MRRRLMLKSSAGVSPVLPAEYQRVKWIGIPEGGYINTNLTVDLNRTFSCDARIESDFSVNRIVFGCVQEVIYLQACINQGTQFFVFQNAAAGGQYGGNHLADNQRHIFELKPDGGYLDHILSYATTRARVTAVPIYIAMRGGDNARPTALTVWGFNALDKYGNYISNMFPCFRKSDGVIGMYDTVTNTFKTNAGTGTFTKGADV